MTPGHILAPSDLGISLLSDESGYQKETRALIERVGESLGGGFEARHIDGTVWEIGRGELWGRIDIRLAWDHDETQGIIDAALADPSGADPDEREAARQSLAQIAAVEGLVALTLYHDVLRPESTGDTSLPQKLLDVA